MFHRSLGMTISEYLLRYRLGISMRMLREETCSITEIAHAVGFASSSSYTEKFRKQTGMTPSEYRNLYSSRDLPENLADKEETL